MTEAACSLMFRIDTYGVHEIGLYKLDNALRQLADWLPRGPRARLDGTADAFGQVAKPQSGRPHRGVSGVMRSDGAGGMKRYERYCGSAPAHLLAAI